MHQNTARTIARVIAAALAGLMILSLLLSLVGCGSDEAANTAPENEAVQPDKTEEETPETEAEKTPAGEDAEEPSEEPVEDGEEEPQPEEPEEESRPEDGQESTEPEKAPAEDPKDAPVTPDEAPRPEQPAEPETPAEPAIVEPDQNGMMQLGDTWIQDPGALSGSSIDKFAQKLQNIRSSYLSGAANVAVSIIPDKSNFAQGKVSSALDHASMVSRAKGGLSGMTYIEIGNLLTLDDYLLTDGHWRQERIVPVANKIAGVFGFSVGGFTQKSAGGFGGDYSKYSGTTETISWMESAHTAATVCDNFQNPGRTAVYDAGLIRTNSPYDLFSGGPTPLVTLKNSAVTTGKRLILFRDSFGSSLAPLLLSGYSEIVMVDLRYMASNLIPQYVDAAGADVLFLFSARVVNNSSMLR
ncbi:MAG: hypothetical protein IJO51_07755 [Clostridia bacterium]|nr:hypothetical protein [Clostridia bacterium]